MAISGAPTIQGLNGPSAVQQARSASSAGTTGSSTGSTSADSSAALGNAFDENSFMKMFLTQLKYQDPTNPLQSYELAAQLAQFSTVEKLTQATSLLQNIQGYTISTNNLAMASLVGKEITGIRTTVDVKADSVGALDYKLDSATAGVTVSIKDADGNVVYSEARGNQDAGSYKIAWDGNDASGARVPEGTYTVEVRGVDSTGNVASIPTTITGMVNSFNLDSSNPYYILSDGSKIPVTDIVAVDSGTGPTAPQVASSNFRLPNILKILKMPWS